MSLRHKCNHPHCGRKFKSDGDMIRHYRDKHGSSPFPAVLPASTPGNSLSSKALLIFIGFCLGAATLGTINQFISPDDAYRAGAAIRAWVMK